MTKLTKKEYLIQQTEIQSKINKLEELISTLPLEVDGLPQSVINLIGDTWNTTTDEIYNLQQELKFLESRWNRRNWTHQDYMEMELVSNNID